MRAMYGVYLDVLLLLRRVVPSIGLTSMQVWAEMIALIFVSSQDATCEQGCLIGG